MAKRMWYDGSSNHEKRRRHQHSRMAWRHQRNNNVNVSNVCNETSAWRIMAAACIRRYQHIIVSLRDYNYEKRNGESSSVISESERHQQCISVL